MLRKRILAWTAARKRILWWKKHFGPMYWNQENADCVFKYRKERQLGCSVFTYSLFTRYQTHCLFPYFWERQWVFIMSRQRILSGTRKAVCEKTANPMQPVNCFSNSYVVDANRKLLYWTLWKDSGFPWIFRAGMIAKQILITQMWDSHNLFMGVVYPFCHHPIWTC